MYFYLYESTCEVILLGTGPIIFDDKDHILALILAATVAVEINRPKKASTQARCRVARCETDYSCALFCMRLTKDLMMTIPFYPRTESLCTRA
jgi:hypothetical protein